MHGPIRKAVVADIERLQELRLAVKENVLSDPSKVTHADYVWFIQNGPLWVYETDRHIKGMAASDPRDGTIWALFVDPAFEGHGIGRELLSFACKSLYDAGHENVSLYTDANSRAEKFYRAGGWQEKDVTPRGDVVFTKKYDPS